MAIYHVFDVSEGDFGHNKGRYETKTPKEAIEKAGYINVMRDYEGKNGNIVVQCLYKNHYRSYVYFAKKKIKI